MESGRVTKNAKNYRLLSQAWMLSQEDERAVPALKEAARLSDDGELDVRLGNTVITSYSIHYTTLYDYVAVGLAIHESYVILALQSFRT